MDESKKWKVHIVGETRYKSEKLDISHENLLDSSMFSSRNYKIQDDLFKEKNKKSTKKLNADD